MHDETVLKAFGFVCRGKIREMVFRELQEPNIPSRIARTTEIRLASVSRALLDLEKHGIVRCINPKERRGRVYQLTTLGKRVFELVVV
ncbi:MAG: ArsR family transcriptional regulator [Candidatus Heimdallarchaeota archaeon]